MSIQFETIGEEVEIYPNPAQEWIRLNLPVGAGSISLVNATGQLVKYLKPGPEQTTFEMDIQDLASGVYSLMIYNTANELIGSEKVVKP